MQIHVGELAIRAVEKCNINLAASCRFHHITKFKENPSIAKYIAMATCKEKVIPGLLTQYTVV
jgi:hypothetical protein